MSTTTSAATPLSKLPIGSRGRVSQIDGDDDYVAPQFDRHGKLDQLMLSGE